MGENISNHKTDKKVISKIHKQLIQFNSKKLQIICLKYHKGLEKIFFQEDILIDSRYMKRYSYH